MRGFVSYPGYVVYSIYEWANFFVLRFPDPIFRVGAARLGSNTVITNTHVRIVVGRRPVYFTQLGNVRY